VHGRGAHAGSAHPHGVNAVIELARVITELNRLTAYDEHLTVNVGRIEGGTVLNRVPHFARAELEMRAFSPAIYDRAKQRILGSTGPGLLCSADKLAHRSEIRAIVTDETVPWPRNPRTDHLIAHWREIASTLGLDFRSEERGGLSDGNVLWDLFPTVDGLGPRGDDAHCSEQSADGSKQQEWVDVTSFVPKTLLNVSAIVSLLQAEPHGNKLASSPAK
jgi:glutamate carboxypeptidase